MATVVEGSVYLVTLTVLSVSLSKVNPKQPYMSFFAVTIMGVGSLFHYFSQDWDISHESLAAPWFDPVTHSLSLFAFAYMFADLPPVLFLSEMEMYERIMFVIHHMVSALQIACSIYYNRYQRLILFFITAESTNFLFNLRLIIPQTGTIKLLIDCMFALCFLGYRMCYLFPVLVRTLAILLWRREWFDLFVINFGAIFIGILHIWWTYLIIANCYTTLIKEKAN